MRARELVTTLNSIKKRSSKLLMLKAIKDFCNRRKTETKYLELKEAKLILDTFYDCASPGKLIVNELITQGYITNVKAL